MRRRAFPREPAVHPPRAVGPVILQVSSYWRARDYGGATAAARSPSTSSRPGRAPVAGRTRPQQGRCSATCWPSACRAASPRLVRRAGLEPPSGPGPVQRPGLDAVATALRGWQISPGRHPRLRQAEVTPGRRGHPQPVVEDRRWKPATCRASLQRRGDGSPATWGSYPSGRGPQGAGRASQDRQAPPRRALAGRHPQNRPRTCSSGPCPRWRQRCRQPQQPDRSGISCLASSAPQPRTLTHLPGSDRQCSKSCWVCFISSSGRSSVVWTLSYSRGQLGDRHRDLGVHAAVVFHLPARHRTAADHHARHRRERGDDQHVPPGHRRRRWCGARKP